MKQSTKKPFIAKSIFMTHARRIGWIRTTLGGGLMYVSVLEFIFLHLTAIIVLYKWMLSPFFGARKFRIKDYIILDRRKIENMNAFDKLNCEFCGYANGTAKLWNAEIDALAEGGLRGGNILIKAIAALYTICLAIFCCFNFIFSKLLFLIISLFLGLHRANTGKIMRDLKERNYASACGAPLRTLLRLAKTYAQSLAENLAQIESSWCPLKHIENGTNVASPHHEYFYDRDRLVEAIETLAKDGSVSPLKPKY
jgi:hypothetical protein